MARHVFWIVVVCGAAIALTTVGCGGGPQIRQTRMRVTQVEIRRVPSGTLFESVENRVSSRGRVEPMTLGSRPTPLDRNIRVLRESTKVRVLYRGTYRALVLLRGGERGYVPVTALQEHLPATAFEPSGSGSGSSSGKRRRSQPQVSVEEMSFDIGLDVIVDQALIDEVNRAPAPGPRQ